MVSITFDDAYNSIYSIALPALKKYDFPFTVFVAPQPVENRVKDFMTWEEISKLTRHGGIIANHSYSHTHFVRRHDDESRSRWLERIREEIVSAEKRIADKTGEKHQLLAYPYGEYTAEIQELVMSLGFVAFGQQSGAVNAHYDMTALPRFPMNNIYGEMEQFKSKVNSLPLPAKNIAPDDLIIDSADALAGGLSISFMPMEGNHQQLNCYLSSHGKVTLKVEREKSAINVKVPTIPDRPVGRSRINCTMPSYDYPGRFRWYSHYWMRKKTDGSWYEEP